MSDRQRIILALQQVVPNVITGRCCSTCSTSGIPDGPYAYFHVQDEERAFSADGILPVEQESRPRYDWDEDDGGLTAEEYSEAVAEASILIAPLHIGYGADDCPDHEEIVTAIREGLVASLKLAQFVVEDPGNNGRRIAITGVDGVPFAVAS